MYGDHTTLFLRNYAALGSLIILVWEYIATLPLEYRFIWRVPNITLTFIIYVFSRYFFLFAQLINFGVVLFPLSRFPVQDNLCQIWAGCILGGASASLVSLNILIISRVYDLYSREWKMGVFVLGLLCSQFMSNIWFSHNYLQENTFDHGCNVIGFDKRIIILICNTMITQTILWGLVTKKRNKDYFLSRTRALMVYENTYIYGLLFGLTLILTPIAAFDGLVRPALILLWPQTFISIVTCRMILNDYRQEARESRGVAVDIGNSWAKNLTDSEYEDDDDYSNEDSEQGSSTRGESPFCVSTPSATVGSGSRSLVGNLVPGL
ncbi:hypothetical protein BJ165DRAFT_1484486 [Panaeolus papilionaceus]|nr:hypothetical protein BJ165DRAFT_1484486 [Panaeolus papilionaceus]